MGTDVSDVKIDVEDGLNFKSSRVLRKQNVQPKIVCAKEERNASIKKVTLILQKSETERSLEETQTLEECSDAVEEVQLRWKKRDEAKRRLEEFEEPLDQLQDKCLVLAQAIAQSQHLVVYTGAGISTAARIPDYRGTNGIWTRLQQGKAIENHDLSLAEPTFTHMALAELYRKKILKYVVSQNCDGLHLRSGLPRAALSELHGNMYIEVCKSCKPVREYLRQFDVTENTARYSHKTMRKCYVCNNPLLDTIVHFGERGNLAWPLNWQGACKNAKNATTILCLGSSLKVLKKYPWLWQMDKPVKKRPNLYIINLQWTPKDDFANVKIHGKCDVVMDMVMKILGIEVPPYNRENDPIFAHATRLCKQEIHTTTQPFLKNLGDNSDSNEEDSDDKSLDDMNVDVKEEFDSNAVKCDTNESYLGISKEEVKKEVTTEDEDCMDEDISLNITSTTNTVQSKKDCLDESYDSDSIDAIISTSQNVGQSKQFNCDTSSNIRVPNPSLNKNDLTMKTTVQNVSNSLPVYNNCVATSPQKPNTVHTKFLINDILDNSSEKRQDTPIDKTDVNILNTFSNERTRSLMHNSILLNQVLTYYQLSNALLAPILSPDIYYYPIQTSFLYPGLHSIINPPQFMKEDNPTNDTNILQLVKSEPVPEVPACIFCKDNYESYICLFYPPMKPSFAKHQYRFSKSENKSKPVFCVCCDCSSDEEDMEAETSSKKDDSDERSSESKMCKLDESILSEKDPMKSKIQAGWFGKGYRKNRRKKR